MSLGEKAKIVIEPEWAYGRRGNEKYPFLVIVQDLTGFGCKWELLSTHISADRSQSQMISWPSPTSSPVTGFIRCILCINRPQDWAGPAYFTLGCFRALPCCTHAVAYVEIIFYGLTSLFNVATQICQRWTISIGNIDYKSILVPVASSIFSNKNGNDSPMTVQYRNQDQLQSECIWYWLTHIQWLWSLLVLN